MRTRSYFSGFACLLFVIGPATGLAKEEKVAVKDVPRAVMDAVTKRFPEAKVAGAGKEDVEGKTVFEVTLKDKKAHNIDVSVSPDGTIREIEQQIESSVVPKAVERTLAEKYPKSKLKFAETVILVAGGKETLDCYEFKVEAGGKVTEVKISADGKIKHVEADDEVNEGS